VLPSPRILGGRATFLRKQRTDWSRQLFGQHRQDYLNLQAIRFYAKTPTLTNQFCFYSVFPTEFNLMISAFMKYSAHINLLLDPILIRSNVPKVLIIISYDLFNIILTFTYSSQKWYLCRSFYD
jgi:hypothetical protein